MLNILGGQKIRALRKMASVSQQWKTDYEADNEIWFILSAA